MMRDSCESVLCVCMYVCMCGLDWIGLDVCMLCMYICMYVCMYVILVKVYYESEGRECERQRVRYRERQRE